MENENAVYRKEKLREEGKIEIPMMIDPARYFIGNIRWIDVLYTTPFIAISIIIIMILNTTGNLKTYTFLLSFLPPTLALTFLWVKHPDRRNISFITTIWWKLKYSNSTKMYEYTKEVKDNMTEDIRSQLGVYQIANDCLETLDNRLVKVLEVTNINLSGISEKQQNRIYSNYQSFLNNYPQSSFPIQIKQFSKPINLSNYLNWVRVSTTDQEDYFKRMFADSYIDKVNEIQKSKNMVSKARYLIVSTKIGSNKNKSIENLSLEAERLASHIRNMLSDKHNLRAKILDNEELFDYIYACIDYENAQINKSVERTENVVLPFTMTKKEYEENKNIFEKEEVEQELY